MLSCSCCFAKASIIPVKIVAKKNNGAKAVTGTVENVFLADPAKGIQPALTISIVEEQSMIILIKPTTTIYDISKGSVTHEDIKAGDKVKVRYEITIQGAKRALTIFLSHK